MPRALRTIAEAARAVLAWAVFPFALVAVALIVAAQGVFGRD